MNLLTILMTTISWLPSCVFPEQVRTFNVLLKQQNLHVLHSELIKRSNPKSTIYGQWLEKESIDTIIRPSNGKSVIDWFSKNNIECVDNSDNLQCSASVGVLSNVFNSTFLYYHDSESGVISDRYFKLNMPEKINTQVDFIIGLNDFPHINKIQIHQKCGIDDDKIISSESIKELYNISDYNHPNVSSQSVVEFLNDACYSASDLQDFMNKSGMPNVTILEDNIIATCSNLTMSPDVEASLDIQYQLAVNNNTNQHYVSVSDWLYQFANKLYTMESPPMVNSMSYGWAEWDQCDPNVFPTCELEVSSEVYTRRTNVEFMKLALRGITLVASSGDAGAPGRTNEECDGDKPLNPAFPASSPWVLAVGGTIFVNTTAIKDPKTPMCQDNTCIGGGVELNCNFDRCGWTSGGGFSDYFNRPWWQVNATSNYISKAKNLPPPKYFNINGRAYPDISLVSHNFWVNVGGEYSGVDGTSASAPSVSGMISILNNLRVSQGKPTLGPVAPLLYHMATQCSDCFKDIAVGSNNSTEEDPNCQYGYHAIEGYDPVYGLGVPNFDRMYNFVRDEM